MKGRSPAFLFYANDWLSSPKIAVMTPAQEGAYFRLLCYAWADPDCSLPDDDTALAQLSRLGEAWFNGGSAVVRACFVLHPKIPQRLVNLRLMKEFKRQQEWRKKSQRGGIQSAKSRGLKGKGGSRVVEPKGNISLSSSSSLKNKTFLSDSDEIRLSTLLRDLIRTRIPDFKEPNIQTWAKSIDLLLRIDKRLAADVEAVIRFAQEDSFWQSNVLSAKTLRDKYDTLNAKRKSRLTQIENRPSLTCSKRVQKGEFLKPCGLPSDPRSRPNEPRCVDHLTLTPTARQEAVTC